MHKNENKIIVIKVGTNVLSHPDGQIDLKALENLAVQISDLMSKKFNVVLISSGAIGSGRALFKRINKKLITNERVEERQVLAAVGQLELMQNYSRIFAARHVQVAQVLATQTDFMNRDHYLNMRRCFTALINNNVLPIVNENDTVAVSELMFTDNDELASLVATMLNAQKLIILTNVDGLYNGAPGFPGSELIGTVKSGDKVEKYISAVKSDFGRGGMQTKVKMGLKLAKLGITVHMANGKNPQVLSKIINNEKIGTTFIPQAAKSSIKRWLGFSENLARAAIVVNKCTDEILHADKVISLLPIGIVDIKGEFKTDDLVKILNEVGEELGVGKAEYSSVELKAVMGQKGKKAFLHYDYMFIK
jgi:glutamate 5-kinase